LVGRHKLPVAAATGAALALVATAAVALYEAHVANAQRDRALALSARNAAVTEFVNMLATESGGAEKPVTISDMLARSAWTSTDPDLRGELTCLHAMTLAGKGRVSEAVDALNATIRDPQIGAQTSASCLQYLAYIRLRAPAQWRE
jgi:hypothetical protein